MSKVLITESYLDGIGDGIRYANGGSDTYKPSQMEAAVRALKKTLVSKTINANGSYDPANDNADGYSGVTVNVPSSQPNLQSKTVTQNGTVTPDQGYDGLSSVTVSVSGGGAAILSGTSEPTAAQGSDGDLYLQYVELPTGYTMLDYIQSNGNQYIDTGYVPTQATSAKLKLNPQNVQESAILGSSWAMNGFFLMFYGARFRWHSGSAVDSTTITVDTDYVVEVSNTKLVVDGTAYNVTPGGVAQSAIRLFSTTVPGGSGASNTKGSYKIYYCNIYEDGALEMALIPAKRDSDDAIGLYDAIGGNFYTNGGSGTFTAGQADSTKPINAAYVKVSGAWQALIGSDITDVGGVSA